MSGEIKELFQYVSRYKPHNIELETKMRPFIPDYIPAVGEIDHFAKVRPQRTTHTPIMPPPPLPPHPSLHAQVPRPDGKPDNLGLAVLDEPCANQSDPTVLQLKLRANTKTSAGLPMQVRAVDDAEKDPKEITKWIASINDVHRNKPAPSVHYTKPMPDIEALMQIWPAQFEELLETARLPDAELDANLADLVRICCSILDIPVYNSLTESLHVLFTLYAEFKANVHFQQQLDGEMEGMGAETMAMPMS